MLNLKKLSLVFLSLFIAIFFAGCAEQGKSEIVAEVQPFDKLCAFEKWKNVAFEGYISPQSVDCEGRKSRTSSSIYECTFKVFSNPQETGNSILVTIKTQNGEKKFNQIVTPPANYKTEDFKVYDNEEALIPLGSKVRFTGMLRKADECQMDAVRLDVVK